MSKHHLQAPTVFEKLLPKGQSSLAGTPDCPIPEVFARNLHVQQICGKDGHDLCEEKNCQGPQGPVGKTGSSLRGWQGTTGPPGQEGKRGIKGPQGHCGPKGGPGPQGCDGQRGCKGNDGERGQRGPQGCSGLGVQGAQGIVGVQGTVGDANGPQGEQGERGLPGSIGENGFQGPIGQNGQNGARGFQGFEGTQGNNGGPGTQGAPGSCTGVQGEAGSQGVVGLPGMIGTNGQVGPRGPQGSSCESGSQGAQGPQGLAGSEGFPGPPGSLGPQGLGGTQGPLGPQGDQGFQQLSLIGSQGFAGDNGPQGDVGAQGISGDNTGQTGPQGPKGFQGPDLELFGPQGFQGDQGQTSFGPQGPIGTQGFESIGPQGFQGPLGDNANGPVNFLFGTDPQAPLAPNQILVDTSTGDFMEPIGGSNAALTWQKIIDLGTDDVKKSVIAASMSDDAKLIAVVMNRDGTANPFLFTSTDGGQFFLFNPLNTQPFTCLDCCSTNSGNVLICGTNSGQLYWSSDSGQNLAAAGPTSDWTSVSINAVGSFAIACANGDFIYTSSDGGQTWSVPRAFALSWIQVMTDNAGTNCAAITSNQIWFSVDAGVSWANPSFAPADLQGPFTAVHLSPDGTQCFLANTSGTIFRKTVPAGAWSVFRNANGLDTGMSTDESKVLVVNTNFTSSYSQDGGTNFFTNDIRTNATPPMRVPLCFTTSGDNAIMTTSNNQVWLGTAQVGGNISVFNSLVGDTAITSHLLTGLVAVPGNLASTDSILEAFGKMLFMQTSPVGGSMHSLIGKVATTMGNQSAQTPVIFPTNVGPQFALGSNTDSEFVFDTLSGSIQYFGLTPRYYNLTMGFSVSAPSATNDIYVGINGPSGPAQCTMTLQPRWVAGMVTQRILVSFNDSFLPSYTQLTSVTPIQVDFSGINWQVSRA